jgi:hypothetical protein
MSICASTWGYSEDRCQRTARRVGKGGRGVAVLARICFPPLPTRSGGAIGEQRQGRTAWAKAREARTHATGCASAFAHPTRCHLSSETGGGPARCGARPPSRISRPVSRVLYGARRSPTLDGHSSGTPVARRFEQPTRTAGSRHRSWNAAAAGATRAFHTVPIRFCSRWGLPCRLRCRKRGALLPHRFTLTAGTFPEAGAAAVCSLWHFP